MGMLKTYLGVGDQTGRLGVKKFTVCDESLNEYVIKLSNILYLPSCNFDPCYLYSTIVFQIYCIICSLLSTYFYYYMGGTKKCRNIYKLNKEIKHFTFSVHLFLANSSEGEGGPMCYIQTHIHARIQTLRPNGSQGSKCFYWKKKKEKGGVKVRGFDLSRSREKERY